MLTTTVNYDPCKTANIKRSDRQNLAKWALTCYGGSILVAFVKRVKSFVYVSILFVFNILSIEFAQGLVELNLKRGCYVLNVDNTVGSNINTDR